MTKQKISPMQKTLQLMRKQGYLCGITEHYNFFCKIRQDLFGYLDLICLKENEIIGIQTTTSAHFQERIKKIKEHKNFDIVKNSGIKIIVHGWYKSKKTKKFICKIKKL
jgi:Fe2+ or Zn2+ uptake regulation protein